MTEGIIKKQNLMYLAVRAPSPELATVRCSLGALEFAVVVGGHFPYPCHFPVDM